MITPASVKILTLIQCCNLGGMEHCALLLMEEFKARGFDNELISLNSLGAMAPILAARGIPARGIPYAGKWGWRSLPTLRRLLRKTPANGMIMVGHNLMGMLAMGGVCHGHRVLSIHYHHRGVKSDWQWRLIYSLAVRRFSCVTFVSEYVMSEAITLAPILRNHSVMAGTIVPVLEDAQEEDKRQARQRLGISASAKVVGNAGWLIQRKRWDVFLAVASRVSDVVPGAVFLIAGDGPERAALERQAETLGIADKIRWLGWQRNLNDFFRSLDVLLFNSDWDAQARTPLEAMANGVPVVASILNGGTREMIADDSMGILLSSHDAKALAQQVLRLLRNPELASSIGSGGRKRIRECASPKSHADRILRAMKLAPPVPGTAY